MFSYLLNVHYIHFECLDYFKPSKTLCWLNKKRSKQIDSIYIEIYVCIHLHMCVGIQMYIHNIC